MLRQWFILLLSSLFLLALGATLDTTNVPRATSTAITSHATSTATATHATSTATTTHATSTTTVTHATSTTTSTHATSTTTSTATHATPPASSTATATNATELTSAATPTNATQPADGGRPTPTSEPFLAATAQPTYPPAGSMTVLFLADPQQWRSNDPTNTRDTDCSNLNIGLNKLDQMNWPTNLGLSIGGQPIGAPGVTVFAGDLCQTGGDYDIVDQALGCPTTYSGGSELVKVRRLYETAVSSNGLTKLKYGPVYFGLGNHDIQSEFTPAVGWSKCNLAFSSSSDFWRYQMWNYITEMHTGLDAWFNMPQSIPKYPLSFANIDTDVADHGTFEWPSRSLNYIVDLGPVDIIQLHRYGGDSDYGRANGLQWLRDQLQARGVFRPLIIVQHYMFSQTTSTPGYIDPSWTDAQRAQLLAILDPYNVLAVCVGHLHNRATGNPLSITFPSGKVVPEIRPGAAFGKNFALLHVTPSTLDMVEGYVDDALNVQFSIGQSYTNTLPTNIWQSVPANDGNYFGKLGSYYFDTRIVSAPTGQIITGVGLVVAWDVTNRVSWKITSANPDGSNATTTVVSGPNSGTNFPNQGGGKYTYADSNAVIAPDNTRVIGVYLYNKNNRYAPGLVVIDGDGVQSKITNDIWEGTWFPGTGGSSSLYCDTNVVSTPTNYQHLEMGGIQFWQKGNRLAVKVLYR